MEGSASALAWEPCMTNLVVQVRGSVYKQTKYAQSTGFICVSRSWRAERSQKELWEGQAVSCLSGSPWYYRCDGGSRGKSSGRMLGMHGFTNSCQTFRRAYWEVRGSSGKGKSSAGGAGWQVRTDSSRLPCAGKGSNHGA